MINHPGAEIENHPRQHAEDVNVLLDLKLRPGLALEEGILDRVDEIRIGREIPRGRTDRVEPRIDNHVKIRRGFSTDGRWPRR